MTSPAICPHTEKPFLDEYDIGRYALYSIKESLLFVVDRPSIGIGRVVVSKIEFSRPSIILIPPYSNHSLRRHHTIPKYQECLETVSRELNVPSIKLQNIFQSHDENIVYFTDFFHFREFGHKLTANEINRIVAKEIVVKRSGF